MYVESKVELKLPKSKLLNLIREPENLNKYHPFCKRNNVLSWPGNGSVDQLEYHNGMKFKDRNDLMIGGKKNRAVVNWVVEGDYNKSSLRIRINPDIKNYMPFKNKFIHILLWFIYIKPMLQSYINHVTRGFSFYIQNEDVVLPNQFGTHRWFS